MELLSANTGIYSTVKTGLILDYDSSMNNYGFPDRLKALKIESGAPKTQEDFAKWLGVSKSIVSEWLRGEALPSMDRSIQLADKFDVSVDWLMRGRGNKRINNEESHQNCVNLKLLSNENRILVEIMYTNLLKSQSIQQNITNQQAQINDQRLTYQFLDQVHELCEKN